MKSNTKTLTEGPLAKQIFLVSLPLALSNLLQVLFNMSDVAVVGRYVLSADIWPLLAKTPPGAGDEIQLTDAIDMLIEKETVEAYHMKGKSHDCGNKLGYMQAFVEYGIRHKTLGDDFKAWLETAVAK